MAEPNPLELVQREIPPQKDCNEYETWECIPLSLYLQEIRKR